MHTAPSLLSRVSKALFAAVFAFIAVIALSTPMTHAAPGVRANVTYQARLMDASGYPVADGVYQVEFSLYDAPVAGTRLWTADGTVGVPLPVNVTVQDGLFTVLLGDGVTQLPFGEIDWNSDSLYLGVTIGADGEMSPRRPITAVPQAINSAQLGGMSPSSTDTYGGESQFTILQASTTAATSTRSALDVRSNGTSVANDFIFRAISSTGLPLFTINSQGTVSTTDLLVDGIAVCRADGTDCLPVASGTSTLQEVYNEGNAITLGNNALELTAIASGTNLLPFFGIEGYASFVAKGFGEGGLALVHASSSGAPTTTYMFFTSDVNDPINATSSYIASQMESGILQIAAENELGLSAENQGNLSLQTVGGNIFLTSATTTMQTNLIMMGEIASQLVPDLDATYLLGTSALRWNGFFSGVTTTYLSVAGQSVCLEDGTNCPAAGASTLQDAYDNGNTILMADGPIELMAASTTLVGPDPYSILLTGTFVSGTNEGIDFSMFANSSNPYLSGTGTSFIYRENRTLQPGLTTSSGIGFSNDDTENFLTLFTVRPSGPSQNITFDNNGITHFPGAGATTTFAQNVALEAAARVDSDLIPRYDGVFSLGNDTNRWTGSFTQVTSTYQHLQSATIPLSPYSGAMLINNEAQGVAAGLDIVTVVTSTPVQVDNIALLYRQDRSVQDQYAEIVMGQTATDNFHRLLLEVKEGADENDIEMTPTSTWASGDIIPKDDSIYSLGLAAYRWNGNFNNATSGNFAVNNAFTVGGQSVCLENGTNCPAGSGTLQTAYDGTGIGEGRQIDLEGDAIVLQGYASGTNVLSAFPGYEGYNHFEILHASNSQEGIAFGSWRAAGFATGTYMSFASNMSDLSDSGTAFRWDQSGTFAIEQTTTTGGISLIMNDLGFDFNGTTTYSDQSFFNDTVNVAGSILVGGLDVCLIDGTNCPTVAASLQDVYNGGTGIEAYFGPVNLSVTSTSPDYVAFPWLDVYKTITSVGYNNDGISLMHASGTLDNQHFVHFGSDITGDPFAIGSSWLMGDTVSGNVELYANTDLFLQAPADEVIIQSVTTTFQSNLVMDGTFVGSNLTPFVTDLYDLGTSVRRWNEVHANNVSLLRDTVGTNLTGPFTEGYSVVGGGFEGSGNEGFDIIMFSSTTNPASGTGTVFMFATEDRTANVLNDAVTSTGMRNHITPSGITSRLFSRHNGGVADLTLSMGSVSLTADAGVPDSRITVNPTDILIDPFTTTTMQGETNLSSNFSWPVLRVENQGIDDDSWGAHIDRLLVGTGNPSTTGTNNYAMVITYSSSTSFGGLCLDDNLTAQTCPSAVNGSIVAEGGIIADAFDLAETYESPDTLEPGDIVIASTVNEMQVVRSNSTTTLPMGIVSTEPGVLLGYQKAGAHPIALAGRVPTKVSTINGEIKPGDLLAPTQIPGVAGKAVEDGPIVGIALQAYNGADIGKIEVFVKTSWYSKPNSIDQVVENNTYITNVVASEPDVVRRGLAKIETGAVKVHISFETLNGYPFVQTTPRGLIVGAWSTDNYSDTGFDIILEQPQTFDVVFGWEARALDGSTMMIMSDGTSLLVDPTSGQVVVQEPEPDIEEVVEPSVEPEPEPAPEPVPEPEPTPEPAPEPAPSPEPSNP